MKAIAIDDFGAAPTLHELPVPEVGEGELLVRVEASSVNGFDLAVARGMVKGMIEYRLPIVLGKDFAGTVEAIGPGVTGFAVGDRVFGVLKKPTLGDGTFAEHVAASAMFVAKIPEGLTIPVAGALGLAGASAMAAIDAINPREGDTVLISGATGGVGAFAVQLAKARGATVIATAAEDLQDHVRVLGADDTVDHTGDLAVAVKALRPDGVNAVVHAAGDGLPLASLLVPGGRIASLLGFGADQLANRAVTATSVVGMPTTETLERLAGAVARGEMTVPIQRTYSLVEAPRALEDFAQGKRGKLAIAIGDVTT